MICRREKFIFIHVPKTGGTSVEAALITPDCELVSNTHAKGFVLNHLTLEDMVDFKFATLEELSDYFVFGFVRHPYDRAISDIHYLSYLDEMKDLSFDEKFDYFMGMKNLGNHVIPQVEFFQGYWHQVDFIGRYETLQLDFKKILHHIGRDTQQKIPWLNKKSTKQKVHLTEDQKKQVYDKYKLDFLQFGYTL